MKMSNEAVMKLIKEALDKYAEQIDFYIEGRMEELKNQITEQINESWRLP